MWIDDRIEQLRQEFFRQGRAIRDNCGAPPPAGYLDYEPGVSDAIVARKTGELYAEYCEKRDALLVIKDEMVARALMEEDHERPLRNS